jgi:tellurite resistance protein TerC
MAVVAVSPFCFVALLRPKERIDAMDTNPWFYVGFTAFVLAMLALDLGVFHRKAHVVRPKEAAVWVAVWVTLALTFAGILYIWRGAEPSILFLTGYLIEQSLSVDNLFVIVMIFSYFSVPDKYQHRVLFWGILGALLMRGIFIAVGAILISRFHWIMYIFGAFLVFTGIRMAFEHDEAFDADKNIVMRTARRFLHVTNRYDGQRFFTLENGVKVATPLLLVLILVEFVDLVFAADSIPAIFAVTTDPFLVYTSNVFAILGLRSMYFLLAGIVHKFVYLKYGLSVILTFVGIKMLIIDFYHVPILLSLVVIVATLAISMAASLKFPPKKAAQPHTRTGSIFGSVFPSERSRDEGQS